MRPAYPLRALFEQGVLNLAAAVLRQSNGAIPTDPDLDRWMITHHFTKVRHMNRALQFLPPLYRDVLTVAYGLGNGRAMTNHEAAQVLNRTEAWVQQTLDAAIRIFAALLPQIDTWRTDSRLDRSPRCSGLGFWASEVYNCPRKHIQVY